LLPSTILDLFGAYVDHPRRVLSGLYHTVQNLVVIEAVVSIIWTFQHMAHLAGKKACSRAKNWGLGAIWPHKWAVISKKAKKAHACMSPRYLSHQAWKSGEWSDLKVSHLKRGINKNVGLYFTYLSRSPPWMDFHQMLHSSRSLGRNHLWQIYWRSVKGRRLCGWGRSKMEGSHRLSHWLFTLCWRDCAASDKRIRNWFR